MNRIKPLKIKLPRNKEVCKHHPLLELERLAPTAGLSIGMIARDYLGIRQQSLHSQIVAARQNRDYIVPAVQVPVVSKLTAVPPYYFNPVLWPDVSWRFK